MILLIQFNVISIQVHKQFIRSQHLCNLHQLIIVVMAVEEGFLAEDLIKVFHLVCSNVSILSLTYHACKHTAVTPQIKTVIILLEVHQ